MIILNLLYCLTFFLLYTKLMYFNVLKNLTVNLINLKIGKLFIRARVRN